MRADLLAPVAEVSFPAMGTEVHVVVHGGRPERLLDLARARVDALERRWSRFRRDSELSALSARRGAPAIVSAETFGLIRHAIHGWRATEGRFDPTVLEAMRANGYAAPWQAGATPVEVPDGMPGPAPGCGGIALVDDLRLVALPAGVGLDPGGIGKGYAADLVTGELRALGADGACVNLGGDLRVSGPSPRGDSWTVEVEDPWTGRPLVQLVLTEGAVATTSRVRRRWRTDRGERHHVLDPATGLPAGTGIAAVTVVAGDGWWAEVLAKAAFVAGEDEAARLLCHHEAAGLVVSDAGEMHLAGSIEEYLA